MLSEWRESRLDEITELIVDCPHSTPKWTEDGVIVLRNQNIRNGRLKLSNPSYTNESGYKDRTKRAILQANDLIFTREAPMGEICQLPEDLRCCLGQRMVLLRANEENVYSKYLLFVMQSSYLQHQIGWNEGTGTTVSNIRIPNIKSFQIPLPSLPEQKAIAHILGSLDDKIELNRKMNETLEAMAQAMFKSWFVDFDPVIDNALAVGNTIPEELAERAEQRKALGDKRKKLPPEIKKLFPSEFIFTDELGWIPKGWKVEVANDIASISIGKTPPRKEQHWFSDKKEDNTIWVSIRDMGNNGVFLGDSSEYLTVDSIKKFNVKVVPAGSILLSFKLTVGRVAIAQSELTTNEAIAHFVAPKYGISKEYLYCYLKNFDFGSLGSTSSIATAVNSKIIKAMPILTPSEDVLSSFEARTNNCFNKIELTTCQINATSKLRDTLLPKLLSGELRIKDAEKIVERVLIMRSEL